MEGGMSDTYLMWKSGHVLLEIIHPGAVVYEYFPILFNELQNQSSCKGVFD